MSNVIIIPENLLATSYGYVSATSEADATMADDNMLSEEPSEFWRSTDNQPGNTFIFASLNGSTTISASAFAICNHNLRRGDQYRAVLRVANTGVSGQTLYPTGTASVTNTAANPHTYLDSDLTDWITPTASGSDWGFQVTFATPTDPPATGADKQAIWAYVKSGSTVSYGTKAPLVQCKVYLPDGLGGFLTAIDCGTKTIKSSTGQWVFWSWDFTGSGVSSGAGVKVELLFSDRDLSYAGGTTFDGQVSALYWSQESADPLTTVTGGDLGGWHTYEPFEGSGISYLPEARGAAESILIQFGSVISFRFIILQIRSDHSPVDMDSTVEVLPTPDGYVEIGCLVLGEAWSPGINFGYGRIVAAVDTSSKRRTRGGQKFGSRQPVRRILSMVLNWLSAEEAHTFFDRIIWRNGILRSFFVALFPDDATKSKHTSFLASLRNPENWLSEQNISEAGNSIVVEFEEEL